MAEIGLKQFRSEGCLSYALWDGSTRDAIFVDPRVERMDEYRAFVVERQLKPVAAVDTHLHADHFSATHLFAREYGAQIAMSGQAAGERVTLRLGTGDRLRAGGIELEAIPAPGHSPEGLVLFGAGLAFTGDTLLCGTCGRSDLPGGNATALWGSLQEILRRVPDSTVILPSHAVIEDMRSAADSQGLVFSTMATERRLNPQLMAAREQFEEMKRAERIPGPAEEIRLRVNTNALVAPAGELRDSASGVLNGAALDRSAPSVASISVDKFSQKLKSGISGALLIDVREPEEFDAGRIPGSRNVPLSEVCLILDELRSAKRIYVSCHSGRRSLLVAKTLAYVGLIDVVNLSGGYQAWVQAGYSVSK